MPLFTSLLVPKLFFIYNYLQNVCKTPKVYFVEVGTEEVKK